MSPEQTTLARLRHALESGAFGPPPVYPSIQEATRYLDARIAAGDVLTWTYTPPEEHPLPNGVVYHARGWWVVTLRFADPARGSAGATGAGGETQEAAIIHLVWSLLGCRRGTA